MGDAIAFSTHMFFLPSHSYEEPLTLVFLIHKMGAKTASCHASGGRGK